MIMLRDVLGSEIRRVRTEQFKTLREMSSAASVSLAYLSEVERGQKEASSEILNAICSALKISVSDLLISSAFEIARLEEEEKNLASQLTSIMK